MAANALAKRLFNAVEPDCASHGILRITVFALNLLRVLALAECFRCDEIPKIFHCDGDIS